MLVVAEADHAAIPLAQREDLKQQQQQEQQEQQQQGADGMQTDQQDGAAPAGPELSEESAAREDQWGAPKGEAGQWASCLR